MTEWLSALFEVQSFQFLRPEALLLWPLLLGLRHLLSRLQTRSEWEAFIDPVLLNPLLQKPAPQGWLTPERLAQCMILVWALALSGPSWKEQPSPFADDKAPLVIALNLSSSMLADDLLPSRLARAKMKVHSLLEARRGSPTALIAFAETAHVVLPLTEDSDILKFYLNELSPNIMPQPGISVEAALDKSAELLASAGVNGSILLVSDRVNSGATNPLSESVPVNFLWVGVQAAAAEDYPLVTTGAGDFAQERAAANIFAQNQAVTVTDMSADDSDLKQLQRRITRQFEVSVIGNKSQPEDGGYYFVFPLLLLLLLWFRKGMVLQ